MQWMSVFLGLIMIPIIVLIALAILNIVIKEKDDENNN